MYQVIKNSEEEFISIRGVRYHIRKWGSTNPAKPILLMLHGWMDVGASFQFVVDAMQRQCTIIAVDWRGFGWSEAGVADAVSYLHYLGDLDALIRHFSPDRPVDIVGHSMGGNVAMVYAAVRPDRVRRLINAEGFGPLTIQVEDAPKQLHNWLDEIHRVQIGDLHLKLYDDIASVCQRLQKTNPRLPNDKAQWLARQWTRETPEGKREILAHPAHLALGAHIHRLDEMLVYYDHITCPTLFVKAQEDSLPTWWRGGFTMEEFDERIKHVSNLTVVKLTDCSHMLHHDQPKQLAQQIDTFLE